MSANNKFSGELKNVTTTTSINAHHSETTLSTDNNADMTRIITYAIPLSCLVIVVVLLVTVGFRRRHRVLDKWISLKQMRNTDPRFIERTGLRRDSEYDSYNDGFVHVTVIENDGEFQKEPEFRVATIS